jgi:8-oxo-dGTP pyrophosphatase MutT (NUDIX family)
MIKRQAVRVLLLNPQGELLLIRIIEPKSRQAFWLTPGGGAKADESPIVSLRREVYEETGLANFEVGPEVWRREQRFSWNGKAIHQFERYYLVPVDRFLPTDHHLPDKVEQDAFDEFRWWSAAKIEQSSDLFAPRQLAVLLRSLIQDGPPASPIKVSR